jgi:hypothetical protein
MLPLPAHARRLGLLLLLLTVPLLARADALDGALLMVELLAAVAGIALLGVVFTVLAYLRPRSRSLQVLNVVGLVVSVLLGVLWAQIFSRSGSSSMLLGFNPFLGMAVPLGLWLGGVRRAQGAGQPLPRMLWVVAAVLGAQHLLAPLVQMLLLQVLDVSLFGPLRWLWWGIQMLLAFGCWWLVLEQVQQQGPLGWQVPRERMLAPAIAVGLGVAYSFFSVVLTMGEGAELAAPAEFLLSLLGFGALGWAVGVLAVWLNQRRYALPVPPPEPV